VGYYTGEYYLILGGTHDLNPEIPKTNTIRYARRHELGLAAHQVRADEVSWVECAC
jgi:hypothetical protein